MFYNFTLLKEHSPKTDLSSRLSTQQVMPNTKLQPKSEVNLAQTRSHSSPASMMNMSVNIKMFNMFIFHSKNFFIILF